LNETPWPDVQDLLDYWSAGNPPLHRLVAAYFGIEDQGAEEDEHRVMTQEELEAWMKQLQG